MKLEIVALLICSIMGRTRKKIDVTKLNHIVRGEKHQANNESKEYVASSSFYTEDGSYVDKDEAI